MVGYKIRKDWRWRRIEPAAFAPATCIVGDLDPWGVEGSQNAGRTFMASEVSSMTCPHLYTQPTNQTPASCLLPKGINLNLLFP
jgi:hypothetical protein